MNDATMSVWLAARPRTRQMNGDGDAGWGVVAMYRTSGQELRRDNDE
jgi:hypothetical protein